MEIVDISNLKYLDICQLLQDDYKWVGADTLVKQFEYLKNKRIADQYYRTENPMISFLFKAVEVTRSIPDYPAAVKGFLETDIVSDTMKEYIYNMLKDTDTDIELLALLQSEASFNEFTKEQIAGIRKALETLFNTKGVIGEDNYQIYGMFNDYIFQLNGNGPIDYIKSLFTEEELAKEFLTHSGMKTDVSFYANRGMQTIDLNNYHLASIYRKFDKFLPEKKMEFYYMVKQTPLLSGADFVANYFKFINNNFDHNFEYNLSRKPLDYRGMSRIQIDDEELYRTIQQQKHNQIVSNFFGYVVKYERNKDKGNPTSKVVLM